MSLANLFHACNALLHHPWMLLVFITLIPLVTYTISSFQFRYAMFVNRNRKYTDRMIPVVPYWIPFLGHAIPMAIDTGAFIDKVV